MTELPVPFLTVILLAPAAEPQELTLLNNNQQSRTLQAIVGGPIELACVEIGGVEFDCWFHEEYRIEGLPPNIILPGYPDHLGGVVCFTRHSGADTLSVEPSDLSLITAFAARCRRARWDWGI